MINRSKPNKLERAMGTEGQLTISLPEANTPYWDQLREKARRLSQVINGSKELEEPKGEEGDTRYVAEYSEENPETTIPTRFFFSAKTIEEAQEKTAAFAARFNSKHPSREIDPLYIQTIEQYRHSQKVRKEKAEGSSEGFSESFTVSYGWII